MEEFDSDILLEEEKSKKIDWKLWRTLFKYAWRHKFMFVLICVFNVFVALCDIIYPQLTRYAIDNIIARGAAEGMGKIIPFAFMYLAVIVLQFICVIGFILFCGRLEFRMSYDLRQDSFKKLQQLSFAYYDKTAAGHIMANMISDIPRLSEMVAWSATGIFWIVGMIIFSVVMLISMNWKLGLLVLMIMPVLTAVSIYFQRRILAQQRIVRKQNSKITGAFNEGIMGAVTTKTLVREERNFDEFKHEATTMKRASIKSAALSAIFTPIVLTLGSLATAIALYAGGRTVIAPTILGTTMTIGVLSSFLSYTTALFDPLMDLAAILAEMQSAQACAERVISLLNAKSDIVDTPEVIEKYGDCFAPKRENWEELLGDVDFCDVSFAYKEGEKVLKDFNLSVKRGEKIALVGETGAGKSTIVNLVCRFYEPTAGRILIDGTDYRERSQLWLQDRLGYVLQSPHLFSGSIRDNIRYGRKDATHEEVVAAAKLVHADEFISGLEKGYDTEVGEGGARLSTGQKQLISFARVILADPRIFVLDEATSSIDTETEALIQSAIGEVLKNRTSFIVAHRLSTIRSADRILVIRGGRIIEMGTHRELMKLGGYYHDLYTTQFANNSTEKLLA